jgi:hypothetical protein
MNKLQLLSAFTLSTIFVNASDDDLLLEDWVKLEREEEILIREAKESSVLSSELNLSDLIQQSLTREASLIEDAFKPASFPPTKKPSLTEVYQEDYFMQEKADFLEEVEVDMILQMHESLGESIDGKRLNKEARQTDRLTINTTTTVLTRSPLVSAVALKLPSKEDLQTSLLQSAQSSGERKSLATHGEARRELSSQVGEQSQLQTTKASAREIQQFSPQVAQQSHEKAQQIVSSATSSVRATSKPTTSTITVAQQSQPQVIQQPQVKVLQTQSKVAQQSRVKTQQAQSPLSQQPRVVTQQNQSPTTNQPRPQVDLQALAQQLLQQHDPLQLLRRLQQIQLQLGSASPASLDAQSTALKVPQ